MHIVIIGGGIAGLVAAYTLAKAGARITLLEAANRLGGLAGAFTIEPGVEIERYYHFICKPDKHYLAMLTELGIGDRLRWVTTDMGLFHNGALRPFGDPLSLFAHPDLSPAAKLRFAMASVRAKLRSTRGWSALEDRTAVEWLVKTFGEQVYDLLYRPLLEKKFRTFAPRISAAWMWSRLNRLGNSRTITQRERIGYLVGGSQLYIDTLTAALTSAGVDIRVGAPARELVLEGSRVGGVRHDRGSLPADFVLLTVPIPHAASLLAGLDHEYFANLRSLDYLNVLAVVLRLSRRFSSNFWTNVSDPRIDLPGFIEYTNLNPCPGLRGDAVLYMPQYLMDEHPFWHTDDNALVKLFCGYLAMVRPDFSMEWVRQSWVFRSRFAQPICETGFSRRIPAIETPVRNLFLTDSYQLHPHDRTISNSTFLGSEAARLILARARSEGMA
jgi:protoporphyrinogen oxidase